LTLTISGDVAHIVSLTGSDPEGASIRFAITSAPDHGRLSALDPTNGVVTFTPTHGFAGPDSFSIRVADGLFDSSDAIVTLKVTAPSDRDGDGIPDYWEMARGLDPDDPGDAAADDDQDGFNNRQEYLANTDPKDSASALR